MIKEKNRRTWVASKDIEGLDEPMFYPVPEGYVQDWDNKNKRYKIRRKRYPPIKKNLTRLILIPKYD